MYAYEFRARPGTSRWTASAVVVTVGGASLILLSLVGLAAVLVLRTTVFGRDPHQPSEQQFLILLATGSFEALYLIMHVPLIAAYVWWRSETRRVLRLFDRPLSLARHPMIIAFWVLLFAGGMLQVGSGTLTEPGVDRYPDQPATRDTYAHTADQHAIGLGLRVLAFAVLAAAVWLVRQRIVNSSPAPAAVTPAPPTPAASAPALPPADEAFWARVARATPLPLLVSTASGTPRWSLVTAENLAAVRARLTPGASLAAFPDAGTLKPAPADEYHAMLQRSTETAPAYRLVLPSQVPAFVAEARGAHRAALYPATDPTALTAQLPH